MNQELIDLLRGELSPEKARALGERLEQEPELARELTELEQLFSYVRRGEEIEPAPDARGRLMALAEASCRPSLLQKVQALPGLFRFRFRQSLVFRVAAVSLGVHLIAMAILFQFSVRKGADDERIDMDTRFAEATPDLRPSDSFSTSLRQRRVPHDARLMRFGIDGQASLIEQGIDTILASQKPDGTFGSVAESAYSALALMGEGDCSTTATRRGRAVRRVMNRLMNEAVHGEAHGAVLTALVEDWTLSFDDLSDAERGEYVDAIIKLIRRLGEDEASSEGRAMAALAGVPFPAHFDRGLFSRSARELMGEPATRLSATIVLARGQELSGSDDTVRAWVRALFTRAGAQVGTQKPSALAVLALQAPYRL